MAPPRLEDWLRIAFDEEGVRIEAAPPGGEAWSDGFRWADVVRVCFEAADLMDSDRLYVFTSLRPESHVLPTEHPEGQEVFQELIRRGLFDATLAIRAATGTGLYCWPPPDGGGGAGPISADA
jgi:hypothetical protein